jgi:hypothetical protein
MAVLVTAIHDFLGGSKDVDVRNEFGHDAESCCSHSMGSLVASQNAHSLDQLRTLPPSTLSVCPVMKAASSLVRKETTPTRSSGTSPRLIA